MPDHHLGPNNVANNVADHLGPDRLARDVADHVGPCHHALDFANHLGPDPIHVFRATQSCWSGHQSGTLL